MPEQRRNNHPLSPVSIVDDHNFFKWFSGVVIAAGAIGYALYAFHQGECFLPGRRRSGLFLEGAAAYWLASAYFFGGCALHFHYFWNRSDRLHHWADIGSAIALAGFVVTLITALIMSVFR